MRYPSVTKLKDAFNHKGMEAIRKWHAKNVAILGAEEAEIARRAGAVSGTRIHKALEENDTTGLSKKELVRYNNLSTFVSTVSMSEQEKRILWVDPEDPKNGFGGTFDLIGLVNHADFVDSEDNVLGDSCMYHMMDYKNVKTFYSLDFYVGYYLQCAAYCAGLNQKTNKKYGLCNGLIAFTTAKTIKLVYLDRRCINWYWKNFRAISYAFAHSLDFDYEAFKDKSCGYINPETGEIEDYLPQRIWIKP